MAARSIASGVALQFGLISASVSMTSALDKAAATSGNVQVCDAGHDARRISQPKVCPECGEVPFQQLKKARPVEGGLVVLEEEDLVELSKDAERFKKAASVSAHPAEQVEVLTTAGEKMYFLTPDKGHEAGYAALLGLVDAHPDLAFMTQWTPRSASAQFRLRSYKGALVFQERTRAGTVRDAPDVTLGDNSALIAMAEQFLAMPGLIVDYDPETYADKTEERLAAILATKEVVAVAGEQVSTVTPEAVDDLMAKLQAHLAAAAPETPARPAKGKKKEKV